jgi:hypothetical protein
LERVKTKDWKEVRGRVDPDTLAAFKAKLKNKGDSESRVIRRAVRAYLSSDAT